MLTYTWRPRGIYLDSMGQIAIPLSKLSDFAGSLPAEVAALAAKIEAEQVT